MNIPKMKAQKDLEKVSLEVELLKKQERNFIRSQKLEQTKVKYTFITTIVAICGLIATVVSQQIQFYSQQKQLVSIQESHLDDDYLKRLEMLSNAKDQKTQLTSLTSIFEYLRKGGPNRRDQLIQLLIHYADADTNSSIKELIGNQLLKNYNLDLVNILIEHNRYLCSGKSGRTYFYDESFTWKNGYTAELRNNANSIYWNSKLLTSCLIRQGDSLANLDLSSTTLSQMKFSRNLNSDDKGCTVKSNIYFEDFTGIIFDHVNFTQTNLTGVDFVNCTFRSVNFDEAILNYANFVGCSFDTGCSFKNVRNDFYILCNESANINPKWSNCTIHGKTFSLSSYTAQPIFDFCEWEFEYAAPPVERTGNNRNYGALLDSLVNNNPGIH